MPFSSKFDGFWQENRGLIFLVCVFVGFLQFGLFTGHQNSGSLNVYPDPVAAVTATSSSSMSSVDFAGTSASQARHLDHPIPRLMEDAEDNYRKLFAKQSKTLREAVAEYKRRYHRNPPRGFEGWWKFAKENNVKLVDEFDSIVEDLAPFWDLSGEEFRRRTVQVGLLPSIDLIRIENGTAAAVNVTKEDGQTDVSPRAKGFLAMVQKFQQNLPDMALPINAKSEGRILVPWEHRQYPNLTVQDSSAGINAVLGGPFVADWRGDGSVWKAFQRSCPPTSLARRLFSSFRKVFATQSRNFLPNDPNSAGGDFAFSRTTDSTMDFCQNTWTHYIQGHFFSDWRTIDALYPVLSPGKGPGFLDIRIPSHYYYGSTARYTYGWNAINLELMGVDKADVPWEVKDDRIFWRGATTGGGSSPGGFISQYQRHRFVRMANDQSNANRTITHEDPPNSHLYVSTPVPVSVLNSEIMDVAFSSATAQDYPGGPNALRADHRFADSAFLGDWFQYKYLVDLDGNGYSGKFLAFLASDSAVLKATVYKEYFDGWLMPWLHYIPLSSTYKEIYNIHAYFSGASYATLHAANSSSLSLPPHMRHSVEGERRLRRIARAGKQWKKTMGREVDMEAYVYRLCLEYARLWADNREVASYH